MTFQLGPHAPMLGAREIDLIHRLWLKAVKAAGFEVHHRDVVRNALEDLEHHWAEADRDTIAARVRGGAVRRAAARARDHTSANR